MNEWEKLYHEMCKRDLENCFRLGYIQGALRRAIGEDEYKKILFDAERCLEQSKLAPHDHD